MIKRDYQGQPINISSTNPLWGIISPPPIKGVGCFIPHPELGGVDGFGEFSLSDLDEIIRRKPKELGITNYVNILVGLNIGEKTVDRYDICKKMAKNSPFSIKEVRNKAGKLRFRQLVEYYSDFYSQKDAIKKANGEAGVSVFAVYGYFAGRPENSCQISILHVSDEDPQRFFANMKQLGGDLADAFCQDVVYVQEFAKIIARGGVPAVAQTQTIEIAVR